MDSLQPPPKRKLQRLPLYTDELKVYYDTVEPLLTNVLDEDLFPVLRNIMLCLVANGKLELLDKVKMLRSLDDVYKFLDVTPLDWDTIFGEYGKINDETVNYITDLGNGPYYTLAEVYQAYPKSPEGGLSSQLIRMSDIVSIQHTTNYNDMDPNYQILLSILDEGYLRVGERTDQFPGIYFYMDIGYNGDRNNFDDMSDLSVTFVFSSALLMSPSWHTNGGHLFGRVDESSYDPTTFHKFLITESTHIAELIMHHDCPLNYLEVLVAPDNRVGGLKKVMGDRIARYPVISATEYNAKQNRFPYKRYYKGIHESLTFTPPPLSLAWYGMIYDESHPTISTIRKTLLNFGLSSSYCDSITRAYTISDLRKYLIKLNESAIPRLSIPVAVHPPF